MVEEIAFCQRCGARLAEKPIEGKRRRYCPSCGYVAFLDPKLAAGVLVAKGDRLVLIRRANEPAIGQWSFPAGYVDRGEPVEDAAVREVKEETGLDVRLNGLVGLYSTSGNPVVLAVYTGEIVGGKLEPGHDAQEAGLFLPSDLPPLAFPRDAQIIEDWLALP